MRMEEHIIRVDFVAYYIYSFSNTTLLDVQGNPMRCDRFVTATQHFCSGNYACTSPGANKWSILGGYKYQACFSVSSRSDSNNARLLSRMNLGKL